MSSVGGSNPMSQPIDPNMQRAGVNIHKGGNRNKPEVSFTMVTRDGKEHTVQLGNQPVRQALTWSQINAIRLVLTELSLRGGVPEDLHQGVIQKLMTDPHADAIAKKMLTEFDAGLKREMNANPNDSRGATTRAREQAMRYLGSTMVNAPPQQAPVPLQQARPAQAALVQSAPRNAQALSVTAAPAAAAAPMPSLPRAGAVPTNPIPRFNALLNEYARNQGRLDEHQANIDRLGATNPGQVQAERNAMGPIMHRQALLINDLDRSLDTLAASDLPRREMEDTMRWLPAALLNGRADKIKSLKLQLELKEQGFRRPDEVGNLIVKGLSTAPDGFIFLEEWLSDPSDRRQIFDFLAKRENRELWGINEAAYQLFAQGNS